MSSYDDLLERILSGDRLDVEAELGDECGLTDAERRSLRAVAHVFGKGEHKASAQQAPPRPEIGGFRLIRSLGSGGAATVFLAEQPSLRRLVAVKILSPATALSAEARARFDREALALAKIRHKNVVTALAFGDDQGIAYLAMEYVAGKGLDEVLKAAQTGGERPSIVQVVGWCRDVARALHAAHDHGVVHRDVKPANIRITDGGDAILVDFGLALDQPDSSLTTLGVFRGSPRYSSPEQVAAGEVAVDSRTDVYSLGVTLYEAIAGRPPFEAASTRALFAAITRGDAPAARRLRPEMPRELDTIITTAMERDPSRRYQSAAALADDLDRLLQWRGILARPPGLRRALAKWVRRRPLVAAGAAAVTLAALVAGGLVVERRIGEKRAREARASNLLSEAADLLARSSKARVEANAVEGRQQELREALLGRSLSAEELSVLAHDGRSEILRGEEETAFHAAINRVHEALALDPHSGRPRAMLAELFMDRWRGAVARGDARLQKFYAQLAAENDPEGQNRAELEGTGILALAVSRNGATIHLFRYEEQADVVTTGERRLVPVPIGGGPSPVPPGTLCLDVRESKGELESGDVVFELGGRPLGCGLFVTIGRPPIEVGDFLIAFDGEGIVDFGDLANRFSPRPDGKPHVATFSRGRGTFDVNAASLQDLGVGLTSPHGRALAGNIRAKVWRDGAVRDVAIEPETYLRPTSAPLFPSDACRVAADSTGGLPLPPGSYVASVSLQGFERQRLPFVIERGARLDLRCDLNPVGTTPPGYVFVPAGVTPLGRPHAVGEGAIRLGPKFTAAFAIQDHETTVRAFLPFLNDSDVDDEWKRQSSDAIWNRGSTHTLWSYVKRDEDGRFTAPAQVQDLPVGGVSFRQAAAYAAWLTEQARKRGVERVHAVPTDLEWEKAARGADARPWPHGSVFSPAWMLTGSSRAMMGPEKIFSFPVDESPLGAFDCGGSMSEWCEPSDTALAARGLAVMRGSAWSWRTPRNLSQEVVLKTTHAIPESGFRLVIRNPKPAGRDKASSRPDSR